MDSLPAHLRDSYARDFRLADDAFYSGRLEATSRGREKYWNHWQKYSAPVGVDPYLQGTNFQKRIRLLSGFAARVRTGYYGNGKQVKNCTVSSAITAVGQTITLACDSNPTKVVGSECLLPRLQIMLDRYQLSNPNAATGCSSRAIEKRGGNEISISFSPLRRFKYKPI